MARERPPTPARTKDVSNPLARATAASAEERAGVKSLREPTARIPEIAPGSGKTWPQRNEEVQKRRGKARDPSLLYGALKLALTQARAKATNDIALLESFFGEFSGDRGRAEAIKEQFDRIDVAEAFSEAERLLADLIIELRYTVKRASITKDDLSSGSTRGEYAPLFEFFDIKNVPEDQREGLAQRIDIEIARLTRPKWRGRLMRGGELATLTAPLFLRRVHAEEIAPDGSLHTEIIRGIDPELMQAVEMYISQRKSRKQGLGDAEGLKFILKRPRPAVRKRKPKAPGL